MKVSDIRKMMTDAGLDLEVLKGSMELASAKEAYEAIPLMTDFSWVMDPGKREAKMNAYAEARRQLDRFVSECVQPHVTQKRYKTAAKRIGLDWNHRETLTQTEAFAVAMAAGIMPVGDCFMTFRVSSKAFFFSRMCRHAASRRKMFSLTRRRHRTFTSD